ncbi:MAG: hypothetical protein ACK5NT_03500 [Pyrinomonadaceae bacterium]
MEFLIVRSDEERAIAFKRLSKANQIGCDTETGGLDPKTSELFSVQFSDGSFNVLVPTSENVSLGILENLLLDQTITKIFHNSRFDLAFLSNAGFEVRNVFDTMLAERVLTRGANQSVSLAETLYRYFAVDLDKSQRKKFGKRWNRIWTDELVAYALKDVEFLPRLMNEQIKWMNELNLSADYEVQINSVLKKC